MTGIVISHANPHRMALRSRPEGDEIFRDVLDLLGEVGCSARPDRIMGEQSAVLFEGGPASGGIYQNGVEVLLLEARNQLAGERLRFPFASGMDRKRTAAPLPLRDGDVASLGI